VLRDVSVTNEEKLVLFLSRLTFEERIADQIAAVLKGSISWDAVYRLSLTHGVASLLHHNSEKLGLNIPHEARETFKAIYWATLAHNIRLYDELEKLLNGLAQDGTDAMVLKGIPLCRVLYRDLGLRPNGDIDLLVRFDDVVRLAPSFRAMGYLPTGEDAEDLLRRKWFKTGFLKRNGFPGPVEVHWNWAQPTRARPNMDLAWGRSEAVDLDGLPIRVLGPEDLLIYLCTHLSYHSFHIRLIWICDIHELISQKGSTLDWSYVCREARRQRLQTPVFVTLNYLKGVFGTMIPVGTLKKVKISELRSGYLKTFLDSDTLSYFRYPTDFWKRELFRLFLIDRLPDRWRFSLAILRNRTPLWRDVHKCPTGCLRVSQKT